VKGLLVKGLVKTGITSGLHVTGEALHPSQSIREDSAVVRRIVVAMDRGKAEAYMPCSGLSKHMRKLET
jgi:hypothetical protein